MASGAIGREFDSPRGRSSGRGEVDDPGAPLKRSPRFESGRSGYACTLRGIGLNPRPPVRAARVLHPGRNETIMEVTVRKLELLKVLQENRAKHRRVFEAALKGYRKEALKQLDELVRELKAGHTPLVRMVLPLPQDHTSDYDRVIRMLGMHVSDDFTLPEQEFAWYVEDDWAWKRQFLSISNSYAAAAVTKDYGEFTE